MRGSRLFFLTLGSAVFLLVACGDDGAATDAGADTSVADSTTDVGGDGGGEVDPEAVAALQALTRGVGTSAALAGPLLAEGTMLRDDARADGPGSGRDTATRERVESGVSGNSIVTEAGCTSFDWNILGLMVTITFTGCVMEGTGEPLDGAITLDVNFGPTEFILTFDSLMVADLGLDGEVGLRLGGACSDTDPDCLTCADGDTECASMQMNQQTMWADINFALGEDFNVTLTDVELDHDSTGTTVGGTGTIGSPTFSGSFTGNAVKWEMMQCLPSSGTIIYQPAGGTAITVEMLATTPDDGMVNVQIPPLPAFPYPLFDPCPPTP